MDPSANFFYQYEQIRIREIKMRSEMLVPFTWYMRGVFQGDGDKEDGVPMLRSGHDTPRIVWYWWF